MAKKKKKIGYEDLNQWAIRMVNRDAELNPGSTLVYKLICEDITKMGEEKAMEKWNDIHLLARPEGSLGLMGAELDPEKAKVPPLPDAVKKAAVDVPKIIKDMEKEGFKLKDFMSMPQHHPNEKIVGSFEYSPYPERAAKARRYYDFRTEEPMADVVDKKEALQFTDKPKKNSQVSPIELNIPDNRFATIKTIEYTINNDTVNKLIVVVDAWIRSRKEIWNMVRPQLIEALLEIEGHPKERIAHLIDCAYRDSFGAMQG